MSAWVGQDHSASGPGKTSQSQQFTSGEREARQPLPRAGAWTTRGARAMRRGGAAKRYVLVAIREQAQAFTMTVSTSSQRRACR